LTQYKCSCIFKKNKRRIEMKFIAKHITKLFTISTLIYSVTFFGGCSGGPGYVPAGSNNNACSQNLSSDMKQILGCPTQAVQQQTTSANLPPPIVIANGGTYGACPSIPTTGDISITAVATDFQNKTPVAGATVSFFTTTSNTVGNASPGITATTDSNGLAVVTLPTGTPFVAAGFSSTDIPTYQFGEILSASNANSLFPVLLVSTGTVQLISGLAGTSVDTTKGSLAGTVWDCSGNPIENATVYLVDAATGMTVTAVITYFTPSGSLDIPSPSQKLTSSDGLFLAMNIPPGTYYAVASGVLSASDTTTTVLGESYVESIPGALSIVNLPPPTAP
jgi:hypothetical protein